MKIVPVSSDYYQKVFDLIKIFSDQYVMLPKSMDEIINLAESFRILVNEKDDVIACAMLDQFTYELAEVKSLAVDKAYQGHGYGRLLVSDCEAAARSLGIKRLFALTYEEKFFHRLGFQTVSMETLPEKVYRECVRCHYFNNCKEIAVVKNL